MSVLYRAVWSDASTADRAQVIERVRGCVASWTQETSTPVPMAEGQSEFQISQGRKRKVASHTVGPDALQVIATDETIGDPTEWTTLVQVVADDEGVHTLVELNMSSDDIARRVSVGRPKVVHDLLAVGDNPQLGSSALLSEAMALQENEIQILTDMLATPTRKLPVIVCSEPNVEHRDDWLRSANKIAARVEGIAVVITLDRPAVSAFRRELGSLAIWDGGIRVYAPGVVNAEADGWRHRYYLRSRLEESFGATINRIVYSVAQLSTRRRVPEVFNVLNMQSGPPQDALGGMVPARVLSEARDSWEFELEMARDEQSSLERELASANGHLSRLKEELVDRGLTDLLWGTQHEGSASIPDSVQYTSEAALAAQMYLSDWLALPDSAVRDLDDIDSSAEAYSWGNKTWRGLRALAAYAQDRASGWDSGGFWEWCASGPALGWPATPKKLAMTESSSVQTGKKFKGTRAFEVDPAVHPSGEIKMFAHLKISEGGGDLAPRVYFHDDTGGDTKKVHVGFIGPHYLVPNTSA